MKITDILEKSQSLHVLWLWKSMFIEDNLDKMVNENMWLEYGGRYEQQDK